MFIRPPPCWCAECRRPRGKCPGALPPCPRPGPVPRRPGSPARPSSRRAGGCGSPRRTAPRR